MQLICSIHACSISTAADVQQAAMRAANLPVWLFYHG